MSEWSFQDDSKMMRNREDCDTSLPFGRFSANHRLAKHPKKVAMKQESPSQTIPLTSDFVDILVNCLGSLYHPCKICLPLFTYIYHEHKPNAGTYFMHVVGYSSTASDVCLVWIGWMARSRHRWGLDNTWRIVCWPYHACRCVMNSTGGPLKTPSVTWFWGDFFMCFRRAGIPPSGGDCKGIPPKMPPIQGLGLM